MHMIQVIFLTVLVFFVIVTIHEWGHYYFAKRAGILVREFAIGFGPKLLSFKRGETRYTLRLIPAGGFVRMAGEDPEIVDVAEGQTIAVRLSGDTVTRIYLDRLDERSQVIRGEVVTIDMERRLSVTLDVDGVSETYRIHPQALLISKGKETQIAPIDRQFGSKTIGQRALAIFAGPFMNFVLAFVLIGIYIQLSGVTVDNPDKVLIGEIVAGRPAADADLKVGDEIRSVNGVKVEVGSESKIIDMIADSPGKATTWEIVRDGQARNVTITPVLDKETQVGKVGIGFAYPTRAATFGETIKLSGQYMKSMTVAIFEGFKKLIFGEFKLDDLGGPVRTAEVTGQIAAQGITKLTSWAALLSLYLGIFNLLPIPALDGSRLIFLGLEAVRGRPLDPNRESLVHFIGFAMIMLLMLVVTYNDILRLFRGEH
ncbi:regulator of sigma E protease [Paenibacillus cellulosilyticus]|uniref:Zinc metalloprotease n=1 Tax=Paenibacillus cellulosilyticus TaxID=375489 RepID=A0A2V2YXR3_9BACL|nr:RIP metalloprotease RseP [Paenibacillus cellulosilyticus]PWW06433.1 regulator of sigma E protease [Paenibacillus cellulosilyticus]QKS46221.1 RIP metalloprotease RseP [Paenibacillus cellulosilyticus]